MTLQGSTVDPSSLVALLPGRAVPPPEPPHLRLWDRGPLRTRTPLYAACHGL